MGNGDQKTWDEKHKTTHGESTPSSFLEHIFKQQSWNIQTGRALDIATGQGRNALYLAERGFVVEAVDISEVGLEEARRQAGAKGLSVDFKQADLGSAEFPESEYDLIVNFNFLQRSLIPKLKRSLKIGGHIIFETYLVDQRLVGHPKNPAYLLDHNELLEFFREFRVLFYREGKFLEAGKESYRASLLGQKVR